MDSNSNSAMHSNTLSNFAIQSKSMSQKSGSRIIAAVMGAKTI